MIKAKRAFVAMEVIPALAVLMLAIWAAMRLAWLGVESHAGATRLQMSVEALAACAHKQPSSDQEVLLVWIDERGQWQVNRFPNRSWLPEVPDPESLVFRWVSDGGWPGVGFWIPEAGFESE